jgi:SAM-dependent methyltransferase
MELDWGEGAYETTARQLEAAAVVALDAASVTAADVVLDLGTGTGNLALRAARRGASVTAVDPSLRLLGEARRRADAEGLSMAFAQGDGARIPAETDQFDALAAVFSVIFAPDAPAAVAEMTRVTKPGGRMVITTWIPEGPVAEIGALLVPEGQTAPISPWQTEQSLRELLAICDGRIKITEASLLIEGASVEAWLDDLETNHPAWRMMRRLHAEGWSSIRQQSVEILSDANEAANGFGVTSRYRIVRVDLPG